MDEDAPQRIKEVLDRIEEHLATLDVHGLREMYRAAVDDAPKMVGPRPELLQTRVEILAACKKHPYSRVKALREMGERAYDLVVLVKMRKVFEKSVHPTISNWEIYTHPKPVRSKICYSVDEVWRFAKDERRPSPPHPFEYEQFLRDHKFFVETYLRDRDAITIEQSVEGLAYRKRIDTDGWIREKGLRISRWLGRFFTKAWNGMVTRC